MCVCVVLVFRFSECKFQFSNCFISIDNIFKNLVFYSKHRLPKETAYSPNHFYIKYVEYLIYSSEKLETCFLLNYFHISRFTKK